MKFFVGLILLLALSERPESMAQMPPRELPVLATIEKLLTESDQYDGHRVVVSGRVRSLEVQTGRRGGEFILMILEENDPDAGEPNLSIEVTSLTLPRVRPGNQVLVQGVYHREGKQAGRLFENFIDADTIVREKS